MDSPTSLKVKTMERKKVETFSLVHNTSRVERMCSSSRMGLRRMTSESIIHRNLHKLNNKLISAQLEHFWCTDEPQANMDLQYSPGPKPEGSHHLPAYSILFAQPRGQHPNVILSQDSQIGVPKFSKLELSQLWGCITLCASFRLKKGFKKSCSPR